MVKKRKCKSFSRAMNRCWRRREYITNRLPSGMSSIIGAVCVMILVYLGYKKKKHTNENPSYILINGEVVFAFVLGLVKRRVSGYIKRFKISSVGGGYGYPYAHRALAYV